jgi:3-hydroxybutyryl-CoA dehydrogenase
MINLKKIIVIGSGTMGSGIAQWFIQQNVLVELIDSSSAQLDKAKEVIYRSWESLLQKNKISAEQIDFFKSNLFFKNQIMMSKDADLVIEAIIEDYQIKNELFLNLDKHFTPNTIFASNTSSFPIGSLGKGLSELRRKRFIGLHFFNPATMMKLVEVIQTTESEDSLCQELYHWFESKGKVPALCKDSPGFIVNRVARNFYGEPLRIAEHDDEEKMREIDFILKEVGEFKMGPFELMDLIGIDVNYSVTCYVYQAYQNEPRFAPHTLQKKMVEQGRLGRKSGRGFYQYD